MRAKGWSAEGLKITEKKVPILLGAQCRQVFELARATGKGRRDFSAILTLIEELVGAKARL